jgi:molecular chaperone DnaJ
MKNYYEILDVTCDADSEALKRAYRRMAKKVHPDHRQGDVEAEERFKDLREAFDVLSDPARRDRYDALYLRQRARADSTGTARSPGGGAATRKRSGVIETAEDIYELIKNRMKNKGKRGEDHRYMLSLTLEEAVRGVRKVIRIPRDRICASCAGRGWNTASSSHVCDVCRGEGEITVSGPEKRRVMACPGCGGTGLQEKIPCGPCKGQGILVSRVSRSVEIPAGVDNGTRLKIRGEGGAGENGGENGDLYIIVRVKEHPVFKRHNLDIWFDLSLHFTEAALGADVSVPTLDGDRTLRVPPGTQAGEVLVLAGGGVPALNGTQRGDQKIRVCVAVPKEITPEERDVLHRWQEMRQKG